MEIYILNFWFFHNKNSSITIYFLQVFDGRMYFAMIEYTNVAAQILFHIYCPLHKPIKVLARQVRKKQHENERSIQGPVLIISVLFIQILTPCHNNSWRIAWNRSLATGNFFVIATVALSWESSCWNCRLAIQISQQISI